MKHIYLLCLLLLLAISCGQKNTLRFPQINTDFLHTKTSVLSGKVFSIGPRLDSLKMEIITECDCCLSYLSFVDDRLFLYESLCLEGDDYFSGTYLQTGNLIILKFDPNIASEIHYPGTDFLPTWSVEKRPVYYSAITLSSLNSEPVISASYESATDYGLIDHSTTSTEFVRYFKQIGAWKRLDLPH